MECPHIDENYVECAKVLNMQNISNAFELCINHYQECACFQKMQKVKAKEVFEENLSAKNIEPIPLFTLKK